MKTLEQLSDTALETELAREHVLLRNLAPSVFCNVLAHISHVSCQGRLSEIARERLRRGVTVM